MVNGKYVALDASTYTVRVGSTQNDNGGKIYKVSDVSIVPVFKCILLQLLYKIR